MGKHKWPQPRQTEVTKRYYLVEVQTTAHRPDQLERIDKVFRRELHHSFGSTVTAHVLAPDGLLEALEEGESIDHELFYNPKEKL